MPSPGSQPELGESRPTREKPRRAGQGASRTHSGTHAEQSSSCSSGSRLFAGSPAPGLQEAEHREELKSSPSSSLSLLVSFSPSPKQEPQLRKRSSAWSLRFAAFFSESWLCSPRVPRKALKDAELKSKGTVILRSTKAQTPSLHPRASLNSIEKGTTQQVSTSLVIRLLE